jgi:hypothetical protein
MQYPCGLVHWTSIERRKDLDQLNKAQISSMVICEQLSPRVSEEQVDHVFGRIVAHEGPQGLI